MRIIFFIELVAIFVLNNVYETNNFAKKEFKNRSQKAVL